jgi:hypothetical protein
MYTMPYLAAPVSGVGDPNGNPEGPRMDLAIIVSGKNDPAYIALKERLPELFPGPHWNPRDPPYSIYLTAFGEDAYKPLYYGGKSRKSNRKSRKSTRRNKNNV